MPKKPCFTKIHEFLKGIHLAVLEMNLTDYSFYAFLNISEFPGYSEYGFWRILSFAVSFYIMARATIIYLSVYSRAQVICFLENNNPKSPNFIVNQFQHQVLRAESDILLEGINKNIEPWQKSNIATLNLLFKAQLMIVPAIIVSCQNSKYFVCGFIILVEVFSISHYFILRIKYKTKIFQNMFHLMSYFCICIILLMVSVVGIFLDKWHTNEYGKVRDISLRGRSIPDIVGLVLLVMIVMAVVMEMGKVIMEYLYKPKKSTRKYYDIKPFFRAIKRRRTKKFTVGLDKSEKKKTDLLSMIQEIRAGQLA